jgi:predicted nucleic acid-binding protein
MPGTWVLLDEIAARRIARSLGLRVMGTLGVLAEAKRQGFVSSVRLLVDKMLASGTRLAPELVTAVLSSVGEA